MGEEKLYIGSKIILGCPMDELTFLGEVKGQPITPNQETRAGYKVTYPDGYISWSPEETFEIAYREVTFAERDLMFPKACDENIPETPRE